MSPSLLVPLVAGHLIGDFLLQPDERVRRRGTWAVLLGHCALVASVSWILTGYLAAWWWMLPLVFAAHFVIDLATAETAKRLERRTPPPSGVEDHAGRNGPVALFVLDQLAHLAVLLLVAAAADATPALASTVRGGGLWSDLAGAGYLRALTLVAGWVVAAWAAGRFLGLLLRRFEDELSEAQKGGLPGGGYWIGVTERSLIYLFLLIGEPSGIGFLAAAKSVFRIGELKEAEDRKLAEYILIGTLVSFTVAMVVGLGTRALLRMLS